MEVSELLIRILILLLPGIIGLFYIQSMINKKIETIWLYLSIIIISFLSYGSLYIIYNVKELIWEGIKNFNVKNVVFFQALLNNNIDIKYIEVFISCLCSLVIAIIITLFINKGWYYKLFGLKLNITHKTGNDCWNDLFENNTNGFNGSVYITDYKEGVIYGGRIINYSADSKRPELLLEQVRVFKISNRKKQLYTMDKLYLKLNEEYIRIEIINEEE